MSNTHRIFAAIKLDQTIQKNLKTIQDHCAQEDLKITWVRPEQIHLTLKFLKSVSSKKLKKIIQVFPDFAKSSNAFEIEIAKLGAFPSIKNPQIIWAGITNMDHVVGLAKSVEEGFCRLGFKKERQKFKPHITLGRVRFVNNKEILSQTISNYEFSKPLVQTIKTVVLYESTLSSKGPIHEPLASLTLR